MNYLEGTIKLVSTDSTRDAAWMEIKENEKLSGLELRFGVGRFYGYYPGDLVIKAISARRGSKLGFYFTRSGGDQRWYRKNADGLRDLVVQTLVEQGLAEERKPKPLQPGDFGYTLQKATTVGGVLDSKRRRRGTNGEQPHPVYPEFTSTNGAYDYIPGDVRVPNLYANEKKGHNEIIVWIKWFQPTGNWAWYMTEFDGEDTCFGLVDGHEVEMGYWSLKEAQEALGTMRVNGREYKLPLERDVHWEPKPLSQIGDAYKRWVCYNPLLDGKGPGEHPDISKADSPGESEEEEKLPEVITAGVSGECHIWRCEHKMYPKEDWRAAVAADETLLGYHDWVLHQCISDPRSIYASVSTGNEYQQAHQSSHITIVTEEDAREPEEPKITFEKAKIIPTRDQGYVAVPIVEEEPEPEPEPPPIISLSDWWVHVDISRLEEEAIPILVKAQFHRKRKADMTMIGPKAQEAKAREIVERYAV